MIAYVDASVVLRLVLTQPNAPREWSNVDQGVASAIVLTETVRSLDRLRLRTRLPDAELAVRRAKALELIASLHIVEVDPIVLERAAQPLPTELGTLDAIHLATALLWRETTGDSLTMATHDVALAIAAEAHGMPVVGIDR